MLGSPTEPLVDRVSPAAGRQRASLTVTDHRPWPAPRVPWVLGQTWRDLLFAHWPVDPEALRARVPPELPLDVWDGRGWIGVTPFEVCGHRVHGAPPVPLLSRFGELNVRTYVTVGGRPGIHFFSLDAASLTAVAGARALYRLPYFPARMAISPSGDDVGYTSRRIAGPPAMFAGRYGPAGAVFRAAAGSFEHWLTERYCLYVTGSSGRVRRADIHHAPWPLQPADGEIAAGAMTSPLGLALDGPPHLLFSARQDVVIWPLASVRDA